MTSKLVALIVACTIWDSFFPVYGEQSCIDEQRFREQVFQRGARGPYRLDCPLDPALLRNPQLLLGWLKDCSRLPGTSPSTSSPARIQLTPRGQAYLEFPSLGPQDLGNYTCLDEENSTASFTVQLTAKGLLCAQAPEFLSSFEEPSQLWENLGSTVTLNCTALVYWEAADERCDASLSWSKDGSLLSNHSLHPQNLSTWPVSDTQRMVSGTLTVTLREPADFGLYSCAVRNGSAHFRLQSTVQPSHTAAVIGAIALFLVLTTAAVVYSKCRLNIKLWYRKVYGDDEINDGKLYDAYISYVNNDSDRKFVNFILKPHLENRYGHKLHLNNNDILPGTEPSAELLMNVSRCRRLILVLSHAYAEQEWCSTGFRLGLLRLLELCQQPIIITYEGQPGHMTPEIIQQLRSQQSRLKVLTWGRQSMRPSSAFWKELALAMPRRVAPRGRAVGDPQTLLHGDKDPILTLNPDYLDLRPDLDRAGDLGLRVPVYKAMPSKAPVLPAVFTDPKASDIDVSDLGSRNYDVRPDFYCLVSEEEDI